MALELVKSFPLVLFSSKPCLKYTDIWFCTHELTQDEEHWRTLHEVFKFKNEATLKYEANKLISEIKPQKSWSTEEEDIFKEIMRYLIFYQEVKKRYLTGGIKKLGNFTNFLKESTWGQENNAVRNGWIT